MADCILFRYNKVINRKKVKEKVGENHMNDIHHLPGKAEAKAVILQHRNSSFYVK